MVQAGMGFEHGSLYLGAVWCWNCEKGDTKDSCCRYNVYNEVQLGVISRHGLLHYREWLALGLSQKKDIHDPGYRVNQRENA